MIDIRQQSRSAESFKYTREIQQPWGGLDSVLSWCKSELTESWRWQLIDVSNDLRPGRYVFYFDSDRDCCAFALKWC